MVEGLPSLECSHWQRSAFTQPHDGDGNTISPVRVVFARACVHVCVRACACWVGGWVFTCVYCRRDETAAAAQIIVVMAELCMCGLLGVAVGVVV